MDTPLPLLDQFRIAIEVLTDHGMLQKDIAVYLGLKPPSLSRMKKGTLSVSPKRVNQLRLLIQENGDLQEYALRLENAQPSLSDEFEYDIFLASPKNSVTQTAQNYMELKLKLHSLFAREKQEKTSSFYGEAQDILAEAFFRNSITQLPTGKIVLQFKEQVDLLQTNLIEKSGLRVVQPRPNRKLEDSKYEYAPDVLSEDHDFITKSRIYLLVCPLPYLFTSAWVELGIALEQKKPIMIICPSPFRKFVPFVISDPSSPKGLVHLRHMESIEEISKEYQWIESLPFFK